MYQYRSRSHNEILFINCVRERLHTYYALLEDPANCNVLLYLDSPKCCIITPDVPSVESQISFDLESLPRRLCLQ